jgi:hypothetical protein
VVLAVTHTHSFAVTHAWPDHVRPDRYYTLWECEHCGEPKITEHVVRSGTGRGLLDGNQDSGGDMRRVLYVTETTTYAIESSMLFVRGRIDQTMVVADRPESVDNLITQLQLLRAEMVEHADPDVS